MLSVKLICLLLLTGCACVTFAQPCQTPWKDCGSTGMKINNVVVPGCCSNPCQMIKGKNSTITVTFTPSKPINDQYRNIVMYLGNEYRSLMTGRRLCISSSIKIFISLNRSQVEIFRGGGGGLYTTTIVA